MMGLRVIQTIPDISIDNGGPSRTCRSLCEAMARAGANVTLLAGDHGHPPEALLLPDPALVTTHLVPITRRLGLPSYGFDAAVAATPADILHDNGIWSPGNFPATTAAGRRGLPFVISAHGMLEPWALAHKAMKKRLAWAGYQHRLLDAAAGLHATAGPERGSIRARMPQSPIAVIANGVDCPDSPPDQALRIGANARTVLVLSRLHPVKNLPGLVAAWARIAADPAFDAWTLAIHGPDADGHRAVVAAAIAAAGLQDRIILGDAVAESGKAALFAGADLFILPSFSENFGIVVAEALAHGVPVVASTGTPWADLPGAGCGWHVPPDPGSLAAALATAMALPAAARAEMGRRGHAHARAAFGWPRIAGQMLGFYDWLLSGRAKGDPAPDFVDAPERNPAARPNETLSGVDEAA
ncbi:MAG: glycosyltransferase [Sandarakinorhabdus sp.]|nr:glycosyltransferase [Sandarakinorhabdus sp.]